MEKVSQGRCSSAGARNGLAGGMSGMALLSPRLVPALRALSPRDTIGLLRLGINPEVCMCWLALDVTRWKLGSMVGDQWVISPTWKAKCPIFKAIVASFRGKVAQKNRTLGVPGTYI